MPDTSLLLPSTFVADDTSLPHRGLVGLWAARGIEVALLPRRGAGGVLSLFGAIPDGRFEGVLEFSAPEATVIRGTFVAAATLRPIAASLHQRGPDSLTLMVSDNEFALQRRRTVVDTLTLSRVAVICHRGLSLGRRDLMNTLTAIRSSAAFGCSGIELDITVPRSDRGEPMPGELRVYHPPDLQSELAGMDTVRLRDVATIPTLKAALSEANRSGVPFIYLDPKLRWALSNYPERAHEAVERIVDEASQALTASPNLVIAIGSETSGVDGAATVIARLRQQRAWPPRLAWAYEITRGTDLQGALSQFRSPPPTSPEIASINLLRVRGGGGGLLRMFVRTIPDPVERELAKLSQPVIFWTAHDDDQFAGTMAAIRRWNPASRAGILTSQPHQLIYSLAAGR